MEDGQPSFRQITKTATPEPQKKRQKEVLSRNKPLRGEK